MLGCPPLGTDKSSDALFLALACGNLVPSLRNAAPMAMETAGHVGDDLSPSAGVPSATEDTSVDNGTYVGNLS